MLPPAAAILLAAGAAPGGPVSSNSACNMSAHVVLLAHITGQKDVCLPVAKHTCGLGKGSADSNRTAVDACGYVNTCSEQL